MRDHLHLFVISSFVILLTSITSFAQSQFPKIAVLQIVNQSNINYQEVNYLATELQSIIQMKTKGSHQVMTQENILQLLPPDKKLEDCLGICEVETGRLLGAQFLITGKLVKFGNEKENLRLSIRLHDTTNGVLISTITIKGRNTNHLEDQLEHAAFKLIEEGLTDLDQASKTNQENKPTIPTNPPPTEPLVETPVETPVETLKNIIKNDIEWIKIEGNQFMMGSNRGDSDENPIHQVSVKTFYMSKTEITVAQYLKCVESGICTKAHWDDGTCHLFTKFTWRKGILPKQFRLDDLPIVCIDWNQARVFAKWVGGDLPSEAQWEYAARSQGQEIKYPWGDQKVTCELSNFDKKCHQQTITVCSKPLGNTLQGLCDMGGNVWEWVLDHWHSSYRTAPDHDLPWCDQNDCEKKFKKHVVRGGGWYQDEKYLRSSFRDQRLANYVNNHIGFRVAIKP